MNIREHLNDRIFPATDTPKQTGIIVELENSCNSTPHLPDLKLLTHILHPFLFQRLENIDFGVHDHLKMFHY